MSYVTKIFKLLCFLDMSSVEYIAIALAWWKNFLSGEKHRRKTKSS